VKKLVPPARIAAWLAVLTIIVLSVVPGTVRPHVLGNDSAEHFVAYFIAGSLFAIGYRRSIGYQSSRRLLSSGILLATCAGLLEFVQSWIPGRCASIGDFEVSAIAAWIGLLAVVLIRLTRKRMLVVCYK
jgi:VanZ family protein